MVPQVVGSIGILYGARRFAIVTVENLYQLESWKRCALPLRGFPAEIRFTLVPPDGPGKISREDLKLIEDLELEIDRGVN